MFIIGHLRGCGGQKVFPVKGNTSGIIKSFQGDVSGKGYNSQQDRVCQFDGIMYCLSKSRAITKCKVLLKDGSIRVLSARERLRWQGFPDEYIDRALAVTEGSDLCEQAGNCVTVNIIYEIAKRL